MSGSVCSLQTAGAAFLASRLSRRLLMLTSQFGCSASLAAMAGYFLLDQHGRADTVRWLPLLIMVVFFIFFTNGLASLVWVMTAELLPAASRPRLLPLLILGSSLVWFLVTHFFFAMFTALGGFWLFLLYAGLSFLLAFVSLAFLPETTGKTEEEIQRELKSRSRCWPC